MPAAQRKWDNEPDDCSSGWSTVMESSHTQEHLRKRSYRTARSVDGKAKERAADSATKRQ